MIAATSGTAYASLDPNRTVGLMRAMDSVVDVPGACIEVGVYEGGTLGLIAFYMRGKGVAPKIYGADTFAGFYRQDVLDYEMGRFRGGDRANEPDGSWWGVAKPGHTIGEVSEWLAKFELGATLLEGRIQETAHLLKDEVFRLVHLDVDIYSPTVFCLDFFWPRLSPGGVIVVDDFMEKTCPGVEKAVIQFCSDHDPETFVSAPGQVIIRRPHGD